MVHPIDPDAIRAVANELRALAADPSTMRAGDDGTGAAPADAPDPATEVLLGLGRLVAELGTRLGVDLSARDPGEVVRRLQALAQVFGKGSTAALIADLDTASTRDRLAPFFRLLPSGPGFSLPADRAGLADLWLRLASRAGTGLLPWLSRELGDAAGRLEAELDTLARGLGLRNRAELVAAGALAGSTAVRSGTIALFLRIVPPDVLARLVADELTLPMLDHSVRPETLTPFLERVGSALGADLLSPARPAITERLRLLVVVLRTGSLEELAELLERDLELRELVRAVLVDPGADLDQARPSPGRGPGTPEAPGQAGATPRIPQALRTTYAAVAGGLATGGSSAGDGPGTVVMGSGGAAAAGPGASLRDGVAHLLDLPPSALDAVDQPALAHGLAGLAGLRGLADAEQLLAAARTQPEIREAVRQLVRALVGLAAERATANLAPDAAVQPGRAPGDPTGLDRASSGSPVPAGLREQVARLLGLPVDLLDPATLAEEMAAIGQFRAIADPARLVTMATENPILRELLRELLWTAPRRPAEDPDRFGRIIRDFIADSGPSGLRGRPRIWNAACGSGLDACSMAIAACEAEPPIELRILATDDPGALLQAARRATYSEAVLALIGPGRLRRWFRATEGGAQLVPEARALVEVRAHRLHDPAPGTDFSIVVSRWRLPILAATERAVAFERFADALLPGGWLLIDEGLDLPPAVAQRLRPIGPGLFRRS